MKDQAKVPDVCPRCANGRPGCTDVKPDGSSYTHRETCATYESADDVCDVCKQDPWFLKEIGAELDPSRGELR